MKKILAFLLAALMLCLTGCGGTAGQTETTEGTTEPVGFIVPEPMTERPDYSVSEDPTTDELRETAVRAMRDMLSIQWSTEKEIDYNKGGAVSEKDYHYDTNTIYAGLPYAEGQTNIYVWLEYYDYATGQVKFDGDGQWLNDYLGNTCAGSLMWAWSTVCDSLTGPFVNHNMVIKYGCVPVGDYTYDSYISTFRDLSTKQICADNGMEKMFECYALIQMADAVTNSSSEHTMMAIEDATVVRTAEGQIDPSQSYIIIQDQAAGTGDKFFEIPDGAGNTVHYTGRTEKKFTFMQLWESDYIPVTTTEFLGVDDPYVKAEVTFSKEQCSTVDELLGGSFESNYPMCMLKIIATDADGNQTDLFFKYFDRYDVGEGSARKYWVSAGRMEINAALEALAEGTYTVTAEVTASTGEVFTPVSIEYTK